MSGKRTFRTVIENAGGGGAFVTVSFDVEKVFDKKRVKIKALKAPGNAAGSVQKTLQSLKSGKKGARAAGK